MHRRGNGFSDSFSMASEKPAGRADEVIGLLDGHEGKLTFEWAPIKKCSPDTALRDITALVEKGILKKDEPGGRSTSYSLA
jgi:Fic family protein